MSAVNITQVMEDPALYSPYNYIPTQSVCIIFLVLFSISTALHLAEAIWFKIWWLLPTAVLAGIGEILGWSGRYWSTRNILNNNAFLMQISTTIIAPTPLLAANFIIFGQMIKVLGQQYSRLGYKRYSQIFLTCDVIALVIQGTGGGLASSADTLAGENEGANIMLGGIVFQLVSLVIFVTLSLEYYIRFKSDRPLCSSKAPNLDSSATLSGQSQWTLKMKPAFLGLAFSSTVIFIRSIYRTIELANGWNGRIISTQVYFNVLDGAMIILAMYTLNFLHPGFLLKDAISNTDNVVMEDKSLDAMKVTLGHTTASLPMTPEV